MGAVAFGLFLYSGINNFGWAAANDVALSGIFALSAPFSVFGIALPARTG
jgi:hypothetical protein